MLELLAMGLAICLGLIKCLNRPLHRMVIRAGGEISTLLLLKAVPRCQGLPLGEKQENPGQAWDL